MTIDGTAFLITGGGSGLGLGFGLHLASRGGRVWAIDRDGRAIDAARPATGGTIRFLEADVGDEAQVAKVVAEVERESRGIGVLINNAAVLRDQALVSRVGRTIKRHTRADWDETLQSNLTAVFLMAREVAEIWIRGRRPGLIVNISSISRHGNPGQSAYAATKAAIDALTVTWSQELAPYRIRVAAIAPGFVQTPMTKRIPPMFLDRIRERTPLDRFGTIEEFGSAIEFVVSNDYFNGRILELDGGLRF